MSKELKKTEEKKNDETKKIDKHAPEDEITADEANKLRKFLKDETEFRGYNKTAILILKQHKCGMKAQSLANQVRNCFRLSEDFDSDSDCSDNNNKLYRKGVKSIQKAFSKSD